MHPKRPKAVLKAAKVPALLVSSLVNIRYLTGIPMSSAVVLIESKHWTLFTDGRYFEVARQSLGRGWRVRDIAQLTNALKRIRRCGMESDGISVERFARWKRKFKKTEFIHTADIIEEFRRSKDDHELRKFRRAQRITREMIRRVPSQLRRPISERDLAWQLRVWAHELGAEELAFDPIVAFGTHTSSPHHHPTSRMLKRGHIVQIDVGARYEGYCADQSAVFFTSNPTSLQKRVLQAICEARDEAIASVRAGVSVRELDVIARKRMQRDGFEEFFVHALGHGVGLEIHEGPTLSPRAPDDRLLSGEIITIEPGVYFPGRFGMRVEEEVVVR